MSPVRPERDPFLPPSTRSAPNHGTAKLVDVLCGNLEDAIGRCQGGADLEVARATISATPLWVRVNALNSPWFLDDMTIVKAVGNKLDVIMIPKVEGPWDIHFVDQYLALLEAKYEVGKPILLHALLETAQGVKNVEEIAGASPRMHGLSLGPADLAASRGMKTTASRRPSVLRRPRRSRGGQGAKGLLSTRPVALHRRTYGGCLRRARYPGVLWTLRRS
jgi:malyl-CoA/(S)-citramalyl-CoA lyase